MSRVVQSRYVNSVAYPVQYAPAEPNIYCPVCRVDYPQSQTNNHILKHTMQNVKYVDQKEEDVGASTQYSRNTFNYPMIEPLEFNTSEMVQVNRRNILKFEKQEKNKRPQRVIEMVDRETQTNNRPVLQYWNQESDLYNCFDSVFNGGGFRKNDLVKNNHILASKRPLNEWEQERLRK